MVRLQSYEKVIARRSLCNTSAALWHIFLVELNFLFHNSDQNVPSFAQFSEYKDRTSGVVAETLLLSVDEHFDVRNGS